MDKKIYRKKNKNQTYRVIKEAEMVGKDIQSSCSPTLGQRDQSVLHRSFTGGFEIVTLRRKEYGFIVRFQELLLCV